MKELLVFLHIREFLKNQKLSFINGDQNVAGYDPYETIKKKIRIFKQHQLECRTYLGYKGISKKIQRKFWPNFVSAVTFDRVQQFD